MALIELENVTKIYTSGGNNRVTALQDATLSLESGEFACVAGPSGSGKSTLLHLIGVLDAPTSGTIRIGGQSTAGLSRTQTALLRRKQIGFIFQAFNLVPVLTAYENVEYVLLLQNVPGGKRRELVEKTLADVQLDGLSHRRVTELSGGQQQRVAIARALVGSPPIILADEPTGNLDSATGAAIIDLLRELNRTRKTTFLLSSHDPRVIDRSDRVIQLQDGRITS